MGESGQPELRIVVRPNRSLPARAAWLVFVAVAGSSLVIGTGFVLAGAWPVLPFMGLESLLVGAALFHAVRHGDDHETVIVGDDRLVLRRVVGKREFHHEFQRYWVRVRLERAGARRTASRLLIGSHGRWLEIGGFVNERRRRALYRFLRRVLRDGPVARSGAIRRNSFDNTFGE